MKLPDFFPNWNPYGWILDLSGLKRFLNALVFCMLLGAVLCMTGLLCWLAFKVFAP